MGFIKLPSNSEKILLELAQAENPTQALNAHYEVCSIRERSVLDGIVRELKECRSNLNPDANYIKQLKKSLKAEMDNYNRLRK